MKGNRTSLREVQEALLSVINAGTILIGHGLETDLCALKVTTVSSFQHIQSEHSFFPLSTCKYSVKGFSCTWLMSGLAILHPVSELFFFFFLSVG